MYALHSRVRYSEADEKGKLSVSGIMNYLQDCCTMQAEDLGVGLSYLAEHHIGWFVTSYQIKLLKEMPMVGESIRIVFAVCWDIVILRSRIRRDGSMSKPIPCGF